MLREKQINMYLNINASGCHVGATMKINVRLKACKGNIKTALWYIEDCQQIHGF